MSRRAGQCLTWAAAVSGLLTATSVRAQVPLGSLCTSPGARPSGARALVLPSSAARPELQRARDWCRGSLASAALPGSIWRFLSDSSRARWVRPAASLILPGSGQLLGGAERGALYLVAEVLLFARFLSFQDDGTRGAEQYRDLAFSVARGAFAPVVRDAAFEYFEAVAKFIESGPYDLDPGPALVPPWDERTFNGRIWLLARQTYFSDPDSIPAPTSVEYLQALEFYRRRAVGPQFQWSWRGAALEQDLYRQTIRASDLAFRRARDQLGLLLANHMLSAIDALISTRLRGRRQPPGVSGELRLGRTGPGAERHLFVTVRAAF